MHVGFLIGGLVLVASLALVAGFVAFRAGSKPSAAPPVACQYTPWSASGPCVGGKTSQSRGVSAGDPAACTVTSREVACGDEQVDCIPGEPDPDGWSPCPACIKQDEDGPSSRWQVVPPARNPSKGGRPCSLEEVLRVEACDDAPPCQEDADCVLGPAQLTQCSAPCGGGTQLSYRTVIKPATGNGTCPDLVQEVACNTQPCQDCGDIDWSSAYIGPCEKVCLAPGEAPTAPKVRQPTGPGDQCPLVERVSCQVQACNADSPKGCVAPTQEQLLDLCYLKCAGVQVPDLGGGAFKLSQDQKVPFCGVSDNVMESVCGGGIASGVCPAPQPCSVSDWSDWGDCSLNSCRSDKPQGGVRKRYRTVVSPARGGGDGCGALIEEQPCNNSVPVERNGSVSSPTCFPRDCSLSDWSALGDCSKACGGGQQAFIRSVTQLPSDGGALCPVDQASFYKTAPCNEDACQDCQWESWDDYTARVTKEGGQVFGPCSSDSNGVRKMGPRKLTRFPDPGASCDYTQAYSVTACNSQGPSCPVGCNGLPCSGDGECDEGTGKCSCNPGFFGPDCSSSCPIGDNGLVCTGNGSCGPETNYTCSCLDGFGGDRCSKAGSYLFDVRRHPWSNRMMTKDTFANRFCVDADVTGSFSSADLSRAQGQTFGGFSPPATLEPTFVQLPTYGMLQVGIRGDRPTLKGSKLKFDDQSPDEYKPFSVCLAGLPDSTLAALEREKATLGNSLVSYMYSHNSQTPGVGWDDVTPPSFLPYSMKDFPDMTISCGLAHFLFCNDENNIESGEPYACTLDNYEKTFGSAANANDVSKCHVTFNNSQVYTMRNGSKVSNTSAQTTESFTKLGLKYFWSRKQRKRPSARVSLLKQSMKLFNTENVVTGYLRADPEGSTALLATASSLPSQSMPSSFYPDQGQKAYAASGGQLLAGFMPPDEAVVSSVSASPKSCAAQGFAKVSPFARGELFSDAGSLPQLFGASAASYAGDNLFVSTVTV